MSGKGEGDRPVHGDRPSRRDGPRVGREKEREQEKRERLGQDCCWAERELSRRERKGGKEGRTGPGWKKRVIQKESLLFFFTNTNTIGIIFLNTNHI